jgi:hypothetical protein
MTTKQRLDHIATILRAADVTGRDPRVAEMAERLMDQELRMLEGESYPPTSRFVGDKSSDNCRSPFQ